MAVPKPTEQRDAAENTAAAGAGEITAATNAAEITAVTGASRNFTLDITFSGLCLLVRRELKEELLILLPDAHAHEHGDGDGIPEHLAVIGAHERYEPSGPFVKKRRFHEFEMSKGTIEFVPRLQSDHAITIGFNPDDLALADFERVTKRPLDPEQAQVQMRIDRGEICTECVIDPGVRWHFGGRQQPMATRLAWRINGLTNTTSDGSPGVAIRFTPCEGEPSVLEVKAVKDGDAGEYRAAFYVYHTPENELPSHDGHPNSSEQDPPKFNHHFGAFYNLFVPKLNVRLPERVPDDDDDDKNDEGEESEAAEALDADASESEKFLRKREKFSGHHGRFYTCTVATAKDETSA